jgi:hypothetical protein
MARTQSAETRAKIGATKIGKPRAADTKAKIAASQKGKPQTSGMTGKNHSEETKARMRAAKLGKERPDTKGKPLSEAHRAKLLGPRKRKSTING